MNKFFVSILIKFIACIFPILSANSQTMMQPCTGYQQQFTCFSKINDGKGSQYSGGFNQGKYEGRGVMISPQLGKYVGFFKAGAADGLGWHLAPNGDSYIGYFKNNQYEGEGRMIYANGSVTKEGVWEKDALKEDRKIDFDQARIKNLNIEFDDAKLDYLSKLIKFINTDVLASSECGRLTEYDFSMQDVEGCGVLKGKYNNYSMMQTAIYMQQFYANHIFSKTECIPLGQMILNRIISEVEKQSINTSYYHLTLARCYRDEMKIRIKSDSNNKKDKELYNKAIELYKNSLAISKEFFIIANIADTFFEAELYVQAKEMLFLIPAWSSFYKNAQNKISQIDATIEENQIHSKRTQEILDAEAAEKKQKEIDFSTPLCVGYRNTIRLATKMCSAYSSDESIGKRFVPCHDSFMTSQGYGPWGSGISSSMNRKCSVYGFNPPQ